MTDSPQPPLPYRVRTRTPRSAPTDPTSMAATSPPATASSNVWPDGEQPIELNAFVPSPEPAEPKVGYKNSPVEHRFKPGQRANPHGRPKGSKSIGTIAREKFYAKVSVREGGRTKKLSKGEIGVTKAVNKFAATGDIKPFLPLLKYVDPSLDLAIAQAGAVQPPSPEPLSQTNKAILDWFVRRASQGDDAPEPGSNASTSEDKQP